MESGSLAEFALEPDASALHFDQTLGDIQAQACAWSLTRLLIFGKIFEISFAGLQD
jgi:hypothetical protein